MKVPTYPKKIIQEVSANIMSGNIHGSRKTLMEGFAGPTYNITRTRSKSSKTGVEIVAKSHCVSQDDDPMLDCGCCILPKFQSAEQIVSSLSRLKLCRRSRLASKGQFTRIPKS